MIKLIVKQFLHHYKIWVSLLPIFVVSGLIFSTSLTILKPIYKIGTTSAADLGIFILFPIITGGVVLCMFTSNAIKQCVDLFDESNDILLLLGSSPRQISVVMTGQMLLIGVIGGTVGSLFSLKAAKVFLALIPTGPDKEFLLQLPIQFSWTAVFIVILLQIALIVFTSMRYCLKNYKKRKGAISSASSLNKRKKGGVFMGFIAVLVSLGATFLLFATKVPNAASVVEFNSSMNDSMGLLLLSWLAVIILMNFLIRPMFRGVVRILVKFPSITNHPMLRAALFNMQYNVEGLIKLTRPVSVITLLIGNFIAMFLNTKLLIDGQNTGSYLMDLIVSLVFIFGAPIVISLANIITSICLFRIETGSESERYFFSGCTPKWIFKMNVLAIGIVSLISIGLTLFGTFIFAIPLLRVTYLGGGDIFKANWTFNILLSVGALGLFFLCFLLFYWVDSRSVNGYLE